MFFRLCSRAPRMMRCPPAFGSGTRASVPASPAWRTDVRGLAGGPELAAELGDLVAEAGGLLEAELLGRLVHLFLEALDEPAELVGGDPGEVEHRGAGR